MLTLVWSSYIFVFSNSMLMRLSNCCLIWGRGDQEGTMNDQRLIYNFKRDGERYDLKTPTSAVPAFSYIMKSSYREWHLGACSAVRESSSGRCQRNASTMSTAPQCDNGFFGDDCQVTRKQTEGNNRAVSSEPVPRVCITTVLICSS